MKVRYKSSNDNKYVYGESSEYDNQSYRTLLIRHEDDSISISMDDVEVQLSTGDWKRITEAFKDRDIVNNDDNTRFDIPHSEKEKIQGWNYF